MKPLAIAFLILTVVLLGLPMAGMMADMEPCPACVADDQAGAWGMCVAILSLLAALLFTPHGNRLVGTASPFRPLLLARPLEEPPRLV
jgi:hypothetical protein